MAEPSPFSPSLLFFWLLICSEIFGYVSGKQKRTAREGLGKTSESYKIFYSFKIDQTGCL